MTNTENAILDVRVQYLEHVAEENAESLKSIAASLNILTQLEIEHRATREGLNRTSVLIEKIEGRVSSIEVEMPGLKMIKGWVVAGVIGLVGLFGITTYHFIVGQGNNLHTPYQHQEDR